MGKQKAATEIAGQLGRMQAKADKARREDLSADLSAEKSDLNSEDMKLKKEQSDLARARNVDESLKQNIAQETSDNEDKTQTYKAIEKKLGNVQKVLSAQA